MPPEVCPNCGADVPPKAKSCPECGADEKTGWSDEAHVSGLGIPDEDDKFDYENFVKEEFGGGTRSPKPKGISWLWWITGVALLLLFLYLFLR
ncbi:MAG TPA: zinc ribbon domain-containing protein [Candidatus Acidoferrales bacterium]|nr:zinc ribbon domain-containing protein [Candidatus Acidoferrales bacterium]